MPRGLAALVMILALLLALLLFVLLLYPLILSQIGLFIGRVPQYVQLLQGWARQIITQLQSNFGSDVVNDKLRDLVSSQAGTMLSVVASTLTGVVGGGCGDLQRADAGGGDAGGRRSTCCATGRSVVRRVDAWLPRRYAGVIRAQAREVDRILSAWVRGQALCCLLLALYYALALTVAGLDLGLIVGLAAGRAVVHPLCRLDHRRGNGDRPGAGAVPALARRVRHRRRAGGRADPGGYVIYPRFLGDRVELPAVWVIFALFAGGAAFGFLGVMLAVPVAATIGVLCRFWLRRYLSSQLYLDPPL